MTEHIFYTDEIKAFIRTVKWPKGLTVDIESRGFYGLFLVLYRDNFNTFSGEEKLAISKIVGETINSIRRNGTPCYLEVEPGNGK